MRITCVFHDREKVWETDETEVVFGRSDEKVPIILDLSPDQRVSRMHGRIWIEDASSGLKTSTVREARRSTVSKSRRARGNWCGC